MAKNNNLTDLLTSIGDAVRTRKGTTGKIPVQELDNEILSIGNTLEINEAITDITGVSSDDNTVMANAIAKAYCDTPSEQIIGTTPRTTAGGAAIKDGVAFVDKVKGNTFVLNQLLRNGDFSNGRNYWSINPSYNSIRVEGGILYCEFIKIDNSVPLSYTGNIEIKKNEKLLATFNVKKSVDGISKIGFKKPDGSFKAYTTNIEKEYAQNAIFYITAEDDFDGVNIYPLASNCEIGATYEISSIFIINVTKMFGAGNEPETVEEFKARLGIPADGDIPYIPYNEGEMVSVNASALVSKSRNLWDERTRLGTLDANGKELASINQLISDFIEVKRNTLYVKSSDIVGKKVNVLCFYDINKNFISRFIDAWRFEGVTIIVPEGTRYIRLRFDNNKIYDFETLISYQEGTYTPYFRTELPLNISDIKDSDGNVLFPNGLCSAGYAHDEIDWANGKAIKRVGAVDMGGLNWSAYNNTWIVVFNLAKAVINNNIKANILCSKYKTDAASNVYNNRENYPKTIGTNTANQILLNEDSVATSIELKELLMGEILYYELSEPIVVDLPPHKSFYKVSNGGTEQIEAQGNTAPMKADIGYRSALSADEIINANNLL